MAKNSNNLSGLLRGSSKLPSGTNLITGIRRKLQFKVKQPFAFRRTRWVEDNFVCGQIVAARD